MWVFPSLPADASMLRRHAQQDRQLHVPRDKVGKDTALASIIRLVKDAQGSKAPIQRVVDTVSGYFVSAVMILAILVFRRSGGVRGHEPSMHRAGIAAGHRVG
jgi:cation transport ATPase